MITLYDHQTEALELTAEKNRVAYYHDMGLGKTFTGAEKMKRFDCMVNLVICQKSKISDWVDHFSIHYPEYQIFDLTDKAGMKAFICQSNSGARIVGVINYELSFRRPELSKLRRFSLLLDESSLIQNETAKRSKFIIKKLQPENVILLSGTPTGGKYEKLWSQLKLLGWDISKSTYWSMFVDYHFENMGGFPFKVVDGYKNVDRLKRKMREYGCHFLKTDDVMDLPEQVFTTVKVPVSSEYKRFKKDRVIEIEENQLIGDNTLTKMLYERQLCGQYNKAKLEAFKDLVESTNDRLIVFYNFTQELIRMMELTRELPQSVVNGQYRDLSNYEKHDNSITFIQFQAGAMGLNLQKANTIIYFSPPLSSELYEQSQKRINRIGQHRTCYYYNLTVTGSIEGRIYKALAMRRNYTERLFEEEEEQDGTGKNV